MEWSGWNGIEGIDGMDPIPNILPWNGWKEDEDAVRMMRQGHVSKMELI